MHAEMGRASPSQTASGQPFIPAQTAMEAGLTLTQPTTVPTAGLTLNQPQPPSGRVLQQPEKLVTLDCALV